MAMTPEERIYLSDEALAHWERNMDAWDEYLKSHDLRVLDRWCASQGYPAADLPAWVSMLRIATGGDPLAVKHLVALGYDPNAPNIAREAPLHELVEDRPRRGDVEMARTLMEVGGDPLFPDVLGETPLAKAIRLGRADLSAVLNSDISGNR